MGRLCGKSCRRPVSRAGPGPSDGCRHDQHKCLTVEGQRTGRSPLFGGDTRGWWRYPQVSVLCRTEPHSPADSHAKPLSFCHGCWGHQSLSWRELTNPGSSGVAQVTMVALERTQRGVASLLEGLPAPALGAVQPGGDPAATEDGQAHSRGSAEPLTPPQASPRPRSRWVPRLGSGHCGFARHPQSCGSQSEKSEAEKFLPSVY